MSPSDEFKERYTKIEREIDTFGRTIGVKKLKPSQQVRVQEFSSALDGMSLDNRFQMFYQAADQMVLQISGQ